MSQSGQLGVNCPLCGKAFNAPVASAGSRVACPHCKGSVKIAGGASNDPGDDQWLRLDDDLPSSQTPSSPITAKLSGTSSPTASPPPSPARNPGGRTSSGEKTGDLSDRVPSDHSADSPFDGFDLPDLVLAAPTAGTKPWEPPALTDSDLAALSGYAGNEDQEPAPVKVVREVPVSDSFRIKCPTCESMLYAKLAQVGKKIRCSDCHATIVVPPPPKAKVKYLPDMEEAKAFAFQDKDDPIEHQPPADPMRKNAAEYLRDAEAAVDESPPEDWTVPSVSEWFTGVFGIFRDPVVVIYWILFTAMIGIPAAIALQYSGPIIILALFVFGFLFGTIVIAHGFAILQSVANGEEKVTEWPIVDFWAWMGPLMTAVCAVGVAAGPIWFASQYFFGSTMMTVTLTMMSLYLLYPFVLLSMLDEQSVFVPFSIEVSKSVTKCSEQWGGFYFSSAILFFVLFLIFLARPAMPLVMGSTVVIAVSVAGVFLYFGMLGRLAFMIGQSVNAPPMVNDVQRNPKLPD